MKPFLVLLLAVLCLSFSQEKAYGHALLTYPAPRTDDADLKTGPCGDKSKTSTPQTLVAGSQLTVTWKETINHPGRFFLSFSFANDQNFADNRVAEIPDTKNGGDFDTTITVPSTLCSNCTLQLIQSMEENRSAPRFYYSCADVRIVAQSDGNGDGGSQSNGPSGDGNDNQSNATPNADGENDSLASEKTNPKFGGCGRVSENGSGPGSGGGPAALLLFLPFVLLSGMKKYLSF